MSTSSAVRSATESPVELTRKSSQWQWVALAIFVAFVYLGTTGALPLVGRDEPRYVQIGRAL